MKRLLLLALALMVASGALAEDTFGLFRMVDGEFVDNVPVNELNVGDTIDLHITLHEGSLFSTIAFEVGMDVPGYLSVTDADLRGGYNFGGAFTNLLVGYTEPVLLNADVVVLATLEGLVTGEPEDASVVFHGADPPSVPGHDGPIYASAANPSNLILCGYVGGTADVFRFGDPVAVQTSTYSDVKALFR
jgi:hypothetical protein